MIYPEISAYPTPIFRYHNDEIGDHLLTIDFYQYGNSKNGYDYERAIGYGYVYPVYDSKPLYGYFNQEY